MRAKRAILFFIITFFLICILSERVTSQYSQYWYNDYLNYSPLTFFTINNFNSYPFTNNSLSLISFGQPFSPTSTLYYGFNTPNYNTMQGLFNVIYPYASNGIGLNSSIGIYSSGTQRYGNWGNVFIDPIQPVNTFSIPRYFENVFSPIFSGQNTFAMSQQTNNNISATPQKTESELITEKILQLTDIFVDQVFGLTNGLTSQIEQFESLALSLQPHFTDTLQDFFANNISSAFIDPNFIQTFFPLAAEFAQQGMEMAYEFASQGMQLGFEFASMGEEVGPMTNRILFMAVQIGLMADRIGEMADRILFMSDNIVKFGNRIVYVSQLIVYTEELLVNVSVLINEAIDTISDMLLTMLAIMNNNDTYLELRAQLMASEDDLALTLIYENMNLMLDHMLEFSLQLLENETTQNQNELIIRELQEELRKITLSANDCYCPGFCVDPNQCTSNCMLDLNNKTFCIDPNQCYSFFIDANNCVDFCLETNQCLNFCLD